MKTYQELTREAIEEGEAEIRAEQAAVAYARAELREKLAAYAHEAWSGWMRWMFEQGGFSTIHADDNGQTITLWTMKPEKYARWQRQMTSNYEDLPDSEQASDRAEADRMMAIFGINWGLTALSYCDTLALRNNQPKAALRSLQCN